MLREATREIHVVAEPVEAAGRESAAAAGIDREHHFQVLVLREIASDQALRASARLPVDRTHGIAGTILAQLEDLGARAADRARARTLLRERWTRGRPAEKIRNDVQLHVERKAARPPAEAEQAAHTRRHRWPGVLAEHERRDLQGAPQLGAALDAHDFRVPRKVDARRSALGKFDGYGTTSAREAPRQRRRAAEVCMRGKFDGERDGRPAPQKPFDRKTERQQNRRNLPERREVTGLAPHADDRQQRHECDADERAARQTERYRRLWHLCPGRGHQRGTGICSRMRCTSALCASPSSAASGVKTSR